MGASIGLSPEIRGYVQTWGVREHPVLRRCRIETAHMANAGMQISPEQGAFMQVLARAVGARRAIEVGVFTGYSSTAVALALKQMHGDDALLIACDASEDYVRRAHVYWREAGVEDVIEPRIGPAARRLKDLLEEGVAGRFDLAFIDADKTGYDGYYEACLELLRPGGIMLLDNMLLGGAVADPDDKGEAAEALRTLARKLHADERVDMTLAALGDGLSILVKR